MKDDKLYIEQILDSVSKIRSFVGAVSKDDFEKDQKTQSAVILQLLLIGELAKKISEETKQNINLPWKEIVGFRDVAVHNYFDVDLDVVWQTLEEDIPVLEKELRGK